MTRDPRRRRQRAACRDPAHEVARRAAASGAGADPSRGMLRAFPREAMPRRRRPVPRRRALALATLLSLSAACAPVPPAHVSAAPTAAVREDASPDYFGEDEVDLPARPLAPIEPAYPPRMRALGREGEVEARVVVLADGSVGGARLVESSDEAFTAAVRDALGEARFRPAERGGHPVASWVTLRLRFRLE